MAIHSRSTDVLSAVMFWWRTLHAVASICCQKAQLHSNAALGWMRVLGHHPVDAQQWLITCQRCYWSREPTCQLTWRRDMTDTGCFVVDKVRGLPSSFPRDKYQSFLLFLTGTTVQVFSSEKMINPPAGADLRSLTSIWQRLRGLARIAGVSSSLSITTQDLAPSLATARRAVLDPTPSLFVYWRTDVLGLLRMATRKLSRYTAVFRLLPAGLLIPWSSSMRFLLV